MSPQQIKKIKQKRKKFVRKWHRRIGLAISLFLLNLAITGILLNHYESMDLHKKYLTSSFILDWYGIQAPEKFLCTVAFDHQICQVDQQLIAMDTTENVSVIPMEDSNLILVANYENNVVLVSGAEIKLLQADFSIIDETYLTEEYNLQLVNAVLIGDQLILEAESGNQLLFDLTDFEMVQLGSDHLKLKSGSDQLELGSDQLDQKIQAKLSKYYREHQIHMLKLVQDLHSGQILTTNGKLLTDLVGLLLILLAVSGIITWQRRKSRSH